MICAETELKSMAYPDITLNLIPEAMKTKLIFAQQPSSDRSSPADYRSSLTINESNFSCFKNLHCLQRENIFRNSDLSMVRNANNRYSSYTVEGSSDNEELFAQYDQNGNLIRSTVVQRNIPLPRKINKLLASADYSDWKMIGNERTIENFDEKSIEYRLILQNETEIRVVYLDSNGENKNRLS